MITIFRFRLGILCFFLPGVLSVIGLHLRGPIQLASLVPEGFVQGALSATHDLAWGLLLPSLIIQCFGWLALYAFVARTQPKYESLAFWGVMLSIAGNLIYLPFAGIDSFIAPAIAELYQQGVPNALNIAMAGFEGSFSLPFMIVSAVALMAGTVLMAILLWKSPNLPGWTAPLYVWHALALTFLAPGSYTIERTGGWTLLLTCSAIAWSMYKGLSSANSEAEHRSPAEH